MSEAIREFVCERGQLVQQNAVACLKCDRPVFIFWSSEPEFHLQRLGWTEEAPGRWVCDECSKEEV